MSSQFLNEKGLYKSISIWAKKMRKLPCKHTKQVGCGIQSSKRQTLSPKKHFFEICDPPQRTSTCVVNNILLGQIPCMHLGKMVWVELFTHRVPKNSEHLCTKQLTKAAWSVWTFKIQLRVNVLHCILIFQNTRKGTLSYLSMYVGCVCLLNLLRNYECFFPLKTVVYIPI